MKDRRLGLMVVGAAAITALAVAEPKMEESWLDEAQAVSTHVHPEGSLAPCMADDIVIAAQPATQQPREHAC